MIAKLLERVEERICVNVLSVDDDYRFLGFGNDQKTIAIYSINHCSISFRFGRFCIGVIYRTNYGIKKLYKRIHGNPIGPIMGTGTVCMKWY